MTTAGTWPEKVKRLRKLMDCSQQELAERLGNHANSVSLWERGKRKPIKTFQRWIDEKLAQLGARK